MEREQRAHARKRISASVTFNVDGGTPLRGWLRDISRGGCFITSPSASKVGETIELVVRLPGVSKPIVGTARVVWVRDKSVRDLPAGMGIEFVTVPEESLAAIDALSGASAPRRSQTVIGIAPPPPTSSPSFSPEAVPQEVIDALRAEAAAARGDAEIEKTERTKLPVAQIESEAREAEAHVTEAELQVTEEEPAPPPPPAPPGPPPQPEPPPQAAPEPPIDLPRRVNAIPKKWLIAAGVGAAGAIGLVALIVGIAHRDRGATADASRTPASETGVNVASEIAQNAVADATLTAAADVSAPVVDAHVEDATLDARGRDGGRDAGRDAGRDGGRDGGRRDAGHDGGHHKPRH